MWIGIMICGLVLGRGEQEAQEENIELPQVTATVASASIRSRHSGVYYLQGCIRTKTHQQTHQVSARGNRGIQYSIPPHYGQRWRHSFESTCIVRKVC
jgi:hypothetical protein